MKETRGEELHDRKLRDALYAAYLPERTPATWVADALAVPEQVRQAEMEHLARADAARATRFALVAPHLVGAVLVASLGIALFLHQESVIAVTRVHTLLPAGANWTLPALLIPLFSGLAIAESVRGFPLLRRWFG